MNNITSVIKMQMLGAIYHYTVLFSYSFCFNRVMRSFLTFRSCVQRLWSLGWVYALKDASGNRCKRFCDRLLIRRWSGLIRTKSAAASRNVPTWAAWRTPTTSSATTDRRKCRSFPYRLQRLSLQIRSPTPIASVQASFQIASVSASYPIASA